MKPYIAAYERKICMKSRTLAYDRESQLNYLANGTKAVGTLVDSTVFTESGTEGADPDELCCSTVITATPEPPDPDGLDYMAETTLITRSIEPNDPDG